MKTSFTALALAGLLGTAAARAAAPLPDLDSSGTSLHTSAARIAVQDFAGAGFSLMQWDVAPTQPGLALQWAHAPEASGSVAVLAAVSTPYGWSGIDLQGASAARLLAAPPPGPAAVSEPGNLALVLAVLLASVLTIDLRRRAPEQLRALRRSMPKD